MSAAARDLVEFIDRSPTPYHAVAEASRRLEAAGYTALSERDAWSLSAGDARYVVRGDGSIVAFQMGAKAPAEAGFHVIGAHTDSPNLRLKPNADVVRHGVRQLAVEPYGGLLLHTWLDRDLSLAGRVTLDEGSGMRTCLVDFERPLLRIPNLAIHLYRELREQGLKLNAQQHAVPVLGLEEGPSLLELLVAELGSRGTAEVTPEQIHGFELMTYDVQPAALAGDGDGFVHAARLDNLASCHAALAALTGGDESSLPDFTRVVVLYDHEEVGSRTAQGAAGSILEATLGRLVAVTGGSASEDMARAIAASFLVSADMAHAVHPNYSDRHEAGHHPRIGQGPVVKINANQSYASDAVTVGRFTALCRGLGIEPQSFVTRSDLACGSTIGPISAARLGIPTVDVGNPMLSMHSCREMAGTADVEPMIRVLSAFLGRPTTA